MDKIQFRNVFKLFGPKEPKWRPTLATIWDEPALLKAGTHVALNDVSLTIPPGKTTVIMGLSGSGKSTLLRLINRLICPTAGHVLVDGRDIMTMGRREIMHLRRFQVSMVFQHFGLLPHKTIIENISLGLKAQGVPRVQRIAEAFRWLELVGLKGCEKRLPAQLSGGMQQRVGLARALATNPEVLLMDEAFSALDPLIRREMQDQLLDLQRTLRKTIVFITHDLDEALRLGDQITLIKEGRIVQTGSPSEIVLNPADEYVRTFVESVNRGQVLTAGDISSPLPPRGAKNLDEAARVHADMSLLAIIPQILASRNPVAVYDQGDQLLGYLSERRVLRAIANVRTGTGA